MLKKLINQGFCFSVMKSYSYLTKAKYYQNSEYEILALSEDFKVLENYGFQLNNDLKETPRSWFNPPGIISKTMNMNDINEFNTMKEKYFKEVYSTSLGSVYELKNRSLKDMFQK